MFVNHLPTANSLEYKPVFNPICGPTFDTTPHGNTSGSKDILI